ncbi:MAG TPA: hypothetical protein VFV10_09905 [Gammaproteobacteria bacterium]|nr:hypothetical protein [Gammaproteobacteria bacterium]
MLRRSIRRPARALALILVPALVAACAQDGDPANPASAQGEAAAAVSSTAAGVSPSAGGFRVARDFSWAETLGGPKTPSASSAVERGSFGLFPVRDFELAAGECAGCATPAAALWYFREEVVAVPRGDARGDFPPLVWVGAPEVVEDARISSDGSALVEGGVETPFLIAARRAPATSSAYADRSTLRFFAERPVRVRGATRIEGGRAVFVARTIWPADARIDAARLELRPLRRGELLATLVEAQWGGTAPDRFPARMLFSRAASAGRATSADGSASAGRAASADAAAPSLAGKAVVAVVLSGAQGDDDGSRAGHLAVATGAFGPHGEWHDWLVDDFYPLDEASPKGIVSAPVPIDNYLFDLNSGQLYYRPAYMLVAVLANPGVAASVQGALQRAMLRYYCRAFDFDLARRNSTALSIEPLRELGWRIPTVGPTSVLAAVIAAPLTALVQRSLASGEHVYAALAAERTRLLPRVAFEVLGHDLLSLVENGRQASTPFERRLAEDVEAVLFVRLPQVPSSRREGTYPERSLLVYGARLLTDPGGYERPTAGAAEPFPAELAASCKTGAQ